jgi:hypothetical protein
MDDTWFKGCADELARCLVDARAAAEACEAYLNAAGRDPDELLHAVDALAAPAAVARVLIELIDQPPQLVLAAVRLCRDLAAAAADHDHTPLEVVAALRTAAQSCAALLESAG